jgi:hypothetical protein
MITCSNLECCYHYAAFGNMPASSLVDGNAEITQRGKESKGMKEINSRRKGIRNEGTEEFSAR